MAIIKKSTDNKCRLGEGVEKREPSLQCWEECKLVQPLWKIIRKLLKKLKIEFPYDLVSALMDM